MRINVLQHTPNEGPGAILDWAQIHNHQVYIYHPYRFGYLPTAEKTDMLVILGGPMSPNDDLQWIKQERELIQGLLDRNVPMFGVCYGAQQITKTLGYAVTKSPAKEVGWAPVYRKSMVIPDLPDELLALHWHEEMFEIPYEAQLLFSSKAVKNQGFVLNHRVIGLQFHFEPQADNVREMVVNDFPYIKNSVLGQSATDILKKTVPIENKRVLFKMLDYITEKL
ncbi:MULTISPECIES: type 1 glutamine amidotransferase [Lactobacillaceae]|jgi:GMP synthase-like glutamine amidotransferase|uniref:GMP synthase glutamine amidotransferase subunit n=2 Tax=Lactobacillaceae TaxID=33958 RepID=A0A081BHU4_9LACO|nr:MULTISPECIES: type 1 glutamine amidotransferase [Lactobacillaceae]ATO55137.1 GMP synthase [Loigolactobacillus coryniformis subsp. coryniformis KCTC 3167 = DSM 20001]KRK14377.1 GMP synthase glutamine amidotransferase subunit [Loigolactobacillus coryniformis subsp. coryniformis KCTC 3167 = DSM 20001]RRG00315.1 MAG: type 1 glutamine amidotransferase [Lactobacillus sp.]GAK47612.1 GMP synthase glutamine amidotransferase subunit [Secundilactobacillus oryzae JCM 18671]